MFKNTKTFRGNLVKKGDLLTSKSNNFYIQLTIAENYSEKQSDETWKELPPFYHNVTLFGKQAELFAKSDIPLGTPLFVTGELSARTRAAWTDNNGVVHPETIEQQIFVNGIGPLIDYGRTVSVGFGKDKEVAAQPTPAPSKPVAPKPAPATPTPTNSDDIFGGDIFGDTSSSGSDDIFGDDFNPFA